MFERIAKLAQNAVSNLRVRSALNPMLWLTGIATPVCFSAAYGFREYPIAMGFLLFVGSVPLLATSSGFLYFAVVKPEKLQSEEYQLRHETLQVIHHKANSIDLDAASLEAIAVTTIRQLEAPGEKPV